MSSQAIIQLIFPLLALGGLFYFTSRNQKKQAAKRMDALSRLSKGDRVITIGGLYGLIDEVHVEEKTVVLDVDGVYLTFELGAIRNVVEAKVQEEVVEEVVEGIEE